MFCKCVKKLDFTRITVALCVWHFNVSFAFIVFIFFFVFLIVLVTFVCHYWLSQLKERSTITIDIVVAWSCDVKIMWHTFSGI